MTVKLKQIDPAAAFKALSNPNRLKVFEIIRNGHGCVSVCLNEERADDVPDEAVCVCEILALMDVTPPTLSHHLKELRYAGLVEVFHRGRWSYYTVADGVLDALSDYFS